MDTTRKLYVGCKVKSADSNPNMEEDSRSMNHFRVTLRFRGRRLTVPFSQGLGVPGEPTAESVLSCLFSDADGIDNTMSFEDWCREYGFDPDSRKAEKIFHACEKGAYRLRMFFGEHYDAAREMFRDF